MNGNTDNHLPADNDAPDESAGGTQRMSKTQILTLMSTASVNFSSMICYSILGPFFPNEAVKKGASDTTVGLIFGCYAFFNLLGSLILGKYIVQIGTKFMLIAGLFVSAWCTIIFGLLDRLPDGTVFIVMCFITRSIDAIGFAGAMTSSFATIAKVFPNNIATVFGCLEIFTGLGFVLGPPIGGFLYQSYGYEIPFISLGCVLLLMVPFNMCVLPSYDATPSKDSFWRLFTLPKIVLICFVIFAMSSSLSFLDPTMSLFIKEKFNMPSHYVGLIFISLALSYSLSSPLLGVVSDKMPTLRKWLMVIGGMLSAVGFYLLGPVPIFNIKSQLWLFVLMLVLIGFSLGMTGIPTFPEILTCVIENGFEEGLSTLGLVSGMFNAVWSCGMFLGPTLGGFLVEKINFEWSSAIQGSIVLIASSLLGIYFIIEGRWKKRSPPTSTTGSDEETSPLLPNGIEPNYKLS
ncbi:MFS-type transporter SLC18B1-like isoform X1 [Acipenser ruthenus]|uniref:MFS-type transporter SLC18B1-like isoform X1 n=1 Tax=Acipenser ruthenus TaxID=7906 RepID=UPI002740E869|nr:MFS-type transporter SLC18B1-like isoform X1 [Acipenser ruthenus]